MDEDLPPLVVTLSGEADAYEAMMDSAVEKAAADMKQMQNELNRATEVMKRELTIQAKTFGMTSREVSIYRLEMAGADAQQIENLRALNRTITALEQEEAEFKAVMKAEEDAAQEARNLAAEQEKAAQRTKEAWSKMFSLENIGNKMKSVGRTLTLYLTTALVGIGAAAVHEFSKFDQAMTETRAIMGPMTNEFKTRMQSVVTEMSKTSRFSPDQLMFGLKGLAAAGLDAEQSLKSLGAVEKFATAGAFGLDRATQLLTDSQSAMGLTSKDAEKNMRNMVRVSDALVKAGDQSTASPEQFAEALANGAADAQLWGAEIETVMALLDAYASKGNKGAAAGSDMGRAMKLLKTSYMENAEAFKKANIQVEDANGNYRNFIDVISDLEQAMEGMSGTQKTAFLSDLGFKALAQNAITPLLGMSTQMKEWEQAQRDATGYTERVAKTQMESFTNEMTRLWNQLKVIGIEIGQSLIPYLKALGRQLEFGIQTWNSFSDGTKQWIMTAGAFLAVLGPMLVGFGTLAVLVAQVKTALIALGMAQAAATTGAVAMNVAMLAIPFAAAAIIAELIGARAAYLEFNEAISRSNELQKEHLNLLDRQRSEQVAAASKGPDSMEKLSKGLQLAERDLGHYEQAVQAARAKTEGIGFLNYDWGESKTELKQYEAMLKNAKLKVEDFKKAIEEGKKGSAVAPQANPMADRRSPELLEDIQKLNEALDLQRKTLGMSAEEAKIFKLQMEGATEAELSLARAAAEQIKQFEEQKKLQEKSNKLDEHIREMQLEAEMTGLSSRQQKIYKFALEGASQAQLDALKAADKHATAIERQRKETEKAAEIAKKYEDPIKKVKREQEELAELFRKGLIPLEVFNKGMEDTQQSLSKEYTAKFRIQGIEGVEAGTAAAMAKLDAFRANHSKEQVIGLDAAKKEALAAADKNLNGENPQVAQQGPLNPKHKGFKIKATEPKGLAPDGVVTQAEKDKEKEAMLERLLQQIATNTAPNPHDQGNNVLKVNRIKFQG